MKREDLFQLPFWSEIEVKLRSGAQIQPISKQLLESGLLPKEATLSGLNMMLMRIRDKYQGKPADTSRGRERFLIREALRKNPRLKKYVKRIGRKVNTLRELITLFHVQISRLEKWCEMEERFPDIPLEIVDKTIKDLRETLLAIHNMQIDLGIEDKVPDELLVRFDSKLREIPAEKRERVRAVIALIKSKDGTWRLPAPRKENDGYSD